MNIQFLKDRRVSYRTLLAGTTSDGSVDKKRSGYFAKSIDFKGIADDPSNMGTPPF
jgi:hypothetical protein